jgi:hypothetical protein
MSIQTTFSCSPSFTQTLFGQYGYSISITVLNAISSLPFHCLARVRNSLIWIDYWTSWNTFSIFIDNFNITNRSYSSASAITSPSCNTTSAGIYYSVLDTN